MSVISDAGKMLEIINNKVGLQVKLERAQESGNKSEEEKYKKELGEINEAAKKLAPQIG